MILTNTTNAFAYDTMKRRVPTNIREVLRLNPDYPASIQQALSALAQAIENDSLIPSLNQLAAPDYESWQAKYEEHRGHTWLNTDWFFAEIYFYRLLIQTVRWWETGRDPYAPKKAEELASDGLWGLLDQALSLRDTAIESRLIGLLHLDIWGNRMDLSFASGLAHGGTGDKEDLLVDDSQMVVTHLLKRRDEVHFIADNTGTEVALDLALADALLDNVAARVIFHLKMHPTFVSDATVPDMLLLIETMESGQHSEGTTRLGARLRSAMGEGRLLFSPDFFWNSAYVLREMPERLHEVFKNAALVITKGDLNYRRMVEDRLWSADTPMAEVTGYFPAPLLALRTMKSDAVVGLRPGLAEQLDTLDPQWRVNGKRGVMQFKP
jgi:uncharacterized protein with ATP-grasp and redox domains